MFTGLILGQGSVSALLRAGDEARLRISTAFALDELRIGESIAVNGACLSVEEGGRTSFTAYASAETLTRTTLGDLRPGSRVNLERALALGERLGGHLVSGHVDAVAEVAEIRPRDASLVIRVHFPAIMGPEVIGKGSVALDGISLTVNDCGPDWLEVNVIPETARTTTVGLWRPGSRLNIESDLLGKYVRSFLQPWLPSGGTASNAEKSSLSHDFLHQHGFF